MYPVLCRIREILNLLMCADSSTKTSYFFLSSFWYLPTPLTILQKKIQQEDGVGLVSAV